MLPTEVTVEVLDVNLTRQAIVLPDYWSDGKFVLNLRGVGAWSMSLPQELAAAEALAEPGASILVTGPAGELFSGPTVKPVAAASQSDPAGTLKFEGIDFNTVLQDDLAWPDPAHAAEAQALEYDVRTGPAETVIRSLISANIGPDAPTFRRAGFASKLLLDPDLGRGQTVTTSSRFDNLLSQCALAGKLGGVGFRIVVDGPNLRLKIFTPRDLSKLVRLDIANGRLTSYEQATIAPSLTRALVGGKGAGTARAFIERSSAASLADEAAWGRRIVTFLDQSSTSDPTELAQAGDDALATGGSVKQTTLTPTDDETMRYQRDWFLGDFITAVVGGQESPEVVTQGAIALGVTGVRIGAQVGDPDPDDLRDLRLLQRVRRLETRT